MIIIIDLKSYYLADTINYFYTGFQITFFIKYKIYLQAVLPQTYSLGD